jgi:hypothetical protein
MKGRGLKKSGGVKKRPGGVNERAAPPEKGGCSARSARRPSLSLFFC